MCAALLLLALAPAADALAAGTQIRAVRIWPAPDYTRLTLESDQPIQHSVFTVEGPNRVVLDLQGVETSPAVKELADKLSADDPYVSKIRIGRPQPATLRIVLDVKVDVKPQAFLLKPVGEYAHRLVLDVYPAKPVDALGALMQAPEAGGDRQPDAAAATEPQRAAEQDSPKPVGKLAETLRGPAEAAKPAVEAPRTVPETAMAANEAAKAAAASPAPERRAAADKPKGKAARKRGELEREVVVAIDAGHGGEDPGAKGRHGTYEKDVTLAIARKLKTMVDAHPNMRAVLVRDGDYFIPLGGRVGKARNAQADLFISIHADAFIRPDARGSSVFALSQRGATSAAARWIAKQENDADLIGGVNLAVADPFLKQTLLDLSQTATINDSLRLAREVLGEIGEINRLHKDEVEQAGFAVLKAPDIPSILVETAFISNPEEERRLKDSAYQDKMASAIYEGIKRYFAKNPALARSKVARSED